MARVAVALRTTIVRSDTAKLALSELGHPRPRRSEPHHGACPLRAESGQLSDRLEMSAQCQKATFAPANFLIQSPRRRAAPSRLRRNRKVLGPELKCSESGLSTTPVRSRIARHRMRVGDRCTAGFRSPLCPLWVMCGRRRLGKNFLSCCSIGRVRSCVRPVCAAVKPLAIMLCADRVPIRSTHSKMR
jgi:hypothetical protein